MRVWSTSTGLDPTRLSPGHDLVLDLDRSHGDLAPWGVYVFDHLDIAHREGVDRAARKVFESWRGQVGDGLTRDEIPWAWVWEFEMHVTIVLVLAHALGLRRALRAVGAESVSVAGGDLRTSTIAAAAASDADIPVEIVPIDDSHAGQAGRGSRFAASRETLLGVASGLGFPAFLRRRVTLFLPYWPLMPVLDRMLDEEAWRPAVWLGRRPTNPRRTLRAALQGGWVGLPTLQDRRHAGGVADDVAERAGSPVSLLSEGIEVGPVLAPLLRELVAERAADDLALARMWDRVLRRGRVERIVCADDLNPLSRIVLVLARRHGVRTLAIAHGAFLIPQPVVDLDFADEVVLWSDAVAPPLTNLDRPIHVFGYPLPHSPTPYRRRTSDPTRPTALVLGQLGHFSTATIDARLTMRSYQAAAAAFFGVFPAGELILRPHPSEGPDPPAAIVYRFPGRRLRVERAADLGALLDEADLCIGGTSGATLQAAVEGVATAVLNLSGLRWPWPLGGDTDVPVAHSESELRAVLERFERSGSLPGQADLLRGLGADGGDAAGRVLAQLTLRPPAP